jgi:hypothetical protein
VILARFRPGLLLDDRISFGHSGSFASTCECAFNSAGRLWCP